MTTGNTTLLGLALPVQGELSGTWGDVVNNSITSLLDSAIAGTTTLSTDADVTLTTTVLAANQAREAILLWTASNGATTRYITAPAQSKVYIVINAGTGIVGLRGAGPTTGITVAVGEKCLAAWSGSDFVKVSTSISGGTVTTASVVSANGFAGTVANATTTPAITLTTSITGVLKGNATAISAASAGTDYVAPGGVLGTPSSGALTNCTADGTNKVGYRNIPAVGTKTGSYTLAVGDVGKYVQVGSGGSITIPDATFAEGDVVSIFNNTTGNITITCSITTAYTAGTDSDKATMTLITRGVATVLFISGTVCVVSGNVS